MPSKQGKKNSAVQLHMLADPDVGAPMEPGQYYVELKITSARAALLTEALCWHAARFPKLRMDIRNLAVVARLPRVVKLVDSLPKRVPSESKGVPNDVGDPIT